MDSISSIREDRLVCPVRALKYYISRTKALRRSDRLFIACNPPHAPVSKDTISRWIRSLIIPHVRSSESVRAHDVRAHATSKAWFAGVPLEEIIKAAAWKTPSSFVSHYLTDTVSAEGAFTRAVLTRRHPAFVPQHSLSDAINSRQHSTALSTSPSHQLPTRRGSTSVPAIPPSSRC
ncbi:hypothetical protein HOLleu_41344 [Holothuria leucospilota]|uniref:Tyr recombinase domain-containing protein n=1 Tax=Holothuria leucospilota TaxID=206669 RepID=A0A9Q1BAM8_HOLLE|nr:hypothetical protein HOLleu_41344 [Holothuria leucospilota]